MSEKTSSVKATKDVVLELKNVSAGYGDTHVLNNISMSVARGERLAIIGRNGVGKTTTLATIMGLTKLHSGQIYINGANVQGMPTHKRSHLGLGFAPQTRDIFPSLTVEENLISGLRNDGDIEEAYDLFPRLKERRNNGGGQLSGGEQQMLSIARTLMGKPDILMLDEPLEGLAPTICDMLMEVFERLASEANHTIILVEQHTELALAFAKRVIILDNGQVVFQGSAKEVRTNASILEKYVGLEMS